MATTATVVDRYDTVIKQGTTFRRTIYYRDELGAIVDLTGARVLFQIRESADSADTLLDFDSDNLRDGQTIGPLNDTGTISFVVSGDLTAVLDFSLAVWDMYVVFPGGEDDCLFEGKISLKKAVTRWR